MTYVLSDLSLIHILRPVAVPVRLSLARIGEAGILCARTRPKYIGGSRAVYQTDELEVPR